MARGAVVVGASSGVGREIARELARRGYDLVLAATDLRDLEAVAADLSTRHGVSVSAAAIDLAVPDLRADDFVESAAGELARIDVAVVTAGVVDPQDDPFAERAVVDRVVRVNYLGAVQVLAAFARHFRRRSGGRIVAISSIAAAAPRARNAVYSSAKAGLETYCEGLRHALHGTPVEVQVYALGYVDTRLAFGQRLRFPVASPESVARHVVSRLGKAGGLRYYPRFWAIVVRCLKSLPGWIRLRLRY